MCNYISYTYILLYSLPDVCGIAANQSGLERAKGHTAELLNGDCSHSCLVGVEEIDMVYWLTIDLLICCWTTENVWPAPLDSRVFR